MKFFEYSLNFSHSALELIQAYAVCIDSFNLESEYLLRLRLRLPLRLQDFTEESCRWMFAFLGHTTDPKLVIKSNNNTPKVNDFLSACQPELRAILRKSAESGEERSALRSGRESNN